MFLTSWRSRLLLELKDKMSVSLMLDGDFNLSYDGQNKLKEYLSKHKNILMKNYMAEQSTSSDICIELTFSMNMH